MRLVRTRVESGGLKLVIDVPAGLPDIWADERALTCTRPPRGVNLEAFFSRFQNDC